MAVHQAQVAKIDSEGRAVPYAYGAPIRVRGPIRIRGKIRVQFITGVQASKPQQSHHNHNPTVEFVTV